MREIIIYQDWIEGQQYVNQQCTKKQCAPTDIIYIDCEKTTDINIALCQQQLFSNPKAYVLVNATFLTTSSLFLKHKHVLATINQLAAQFDFYLLVNKKVLANSEIKQLLSDFTITELKITTLKQKQQLVDRLMKAQQITIPTPIYEALLKLTDNNYGNIYHELQKIANLLTTDCPHQAIIDNIANYNEENIFNLLEAIVLNKHQQVWKIYQDLNNRQVDELAMLPALTTQALNLYLCLGMVKNRIPAVEISQKTNINVYFVNQYITKFKHLDFNIFKEIILLLYNLEIDIKLSKVDKQSGFKQCLITLVRMSGR